MHRLRAFLLTALVIVASTFCLAQTVPAVQVVRAAVDRTRLAQSGTPPFHLKAATTPANSFIPDYTAEIEEYWVSPQKWSRTIKSRSFTQTIVVNGPLRSETSSADYYPKWLNDIVVALFEVAPQQAVEELAKLPDATEQGNGAYLRYQPSSTDGKATNAWGGEISVNKAGLLTEFFGKYFSADYREYEDFHGRPVAHSIETFPPTPHGDVTTKIEISDLGKVDEAMFSIDQPTPPEKQTRFTYMDEVEYRRLAIEAPEMKWAPVKRQPVTGVMSMYIVTDRNGKVREADFITGNNMAMKEDAEKLIKNWRFKPVLVDGVPAEVETTMTFNYVTTVEGDQAKYKAASYYFKRGRDLTYPRTDGSPAFHLKGTFSWVQQSATHRGSYEEFWYAPNRWRREVSIGGAKTVETRIDDDYYSDPPVRTAPELVSRADSLFGAEFPGYAYYSPDWDWHMDDIDFLGQKLLRVSMGPLNKIPEGQYPRAYYFDEGELVRARSQGRELITYQDFQPWSGKQVPYTIKLLFGKDLALEAHIDLLEPGKSRDDDFFELPNVKPTDWVRPAPW